MRLARGGEVLAPGDGSDPVQFIDARDLAEWTIRMAEQRTLGVFNATGPARRSSMRDMLAGIATAARPAPASPGFRRNSSRPRTSRPGPTCRCGSRARATRPASPGAASPARSPPGSTFRPLATTAGDTLAWFRTQPAERQAKLRSGLAPEREAEVLARWKASRAKGA